MLVSGIEQGESDIYTYTYSHSSFFFFKENSSLQILFYF